MESSFFPRRQAKQTSSRPDYYDFLPEIMALNERPPSPLGRTVLWLCLGLLVAGTLWAYLSWVDTVVVAEGRVIPHGYVTPVQVPYGGVVKRIHVTEGTLVRNGAALLDFDTTVSHSNLQQTRERLENAQRKAARYRAILSGVESEGIPATLLARDDAIVRQTVLMQRQRLQDLAREQQQLGDELEVARADQKRAAQSLQITEKLLVGTRELAGTGYVSKFKLLETEQQAIQQRFDLEAAGRRLTQAEHKMARLQNQLAAARSSFNADMLERQTEAESEVVLIANELTKAEQESRNASLTAPAEGYVTDLKVHAAGAVVAPGSQILSLVPRQALLSVEAELANTNVAKVRPGMAVAIKLAAYPFNKFGTVAGRLDGISADAIGTDPQSSNYRVRVTIDPQQEVLRSGRIKLMPGMRATVEIKTGQRRYIEYLTTPLVQTLQTAGKES
ncbi:HlyD family type I secretion periplasmic adaptor subunit [Parachitinimonas caeni]|uniref:Membrane fusion protein (MFP) family protein n=1 Tax=Parachitinimonas caeni TaxID=3031301 RepID=A0ABT7E1Y6_9NEIS|nr:HlyD family type I secretion periplasmic adaptor subunit [Parachitinimonas caeni]MDK2125425.1 HlyD family type I secretion periplasmic adaptor subunit [Parachitinimonas caeni]